MIYGVKDCITGESRAVKPLEGRRQCLSVQSTRRSLYKGVIQSLVEDEESEIELISFGVVPLPDKTLRIGYVWKLFSHRCSVRPRDSGNRNMPKSIYRSPAFLSSHQVVYLRAHRQSSIKTTGVSPYDSA